MAHPPLKSQSIGKKVHLLVHNLELSQVHIIYEDGQMQCLKPGGMSEWSPSGHQLRTMASGQTGRS